MESICPQKRARSGTAKRTAAKEEDKPEHELIRSLRRIDPILAFLVKATGKPTVPLRTLETALPQSLGSIQRDTLLEHVQELARRGILYVQTSSDDADQIGFPPPTSLNDENNTSTVQAESKLSKKKRNAGPLHGTTKTAAKRRLSALKQSLKVNQVIVGKQQIESHNTEDDSTTTTSLDEDKKPSKDDDLPCIDEDTICEGQESEARQALHSLLNFTRSTEHNSQQDMATVLPRQASYAGSNAGRSPSYGILSESSLSKIPSILLGALGLERPNDDTSNLEQGKRLYQHQVDAIDSAMDNIHTLVCTGTGSGKSLCFLLPVLAAALQTSKEISDGRASGQRRGCVSFLMFPTKALAQDQFSKLKTLLNTHPELRQFIIPGILDGDTSHADRARVASSCNLILTNPDTLHAAILPGWAKLYRPLLERVRYVVIDEAHMYEGVFGAHVAMVLARLERLCIVCSATAHEDDRTESPRTNLPIFLACSATMSHPEDQFRLLCPIPRDDPVKVISTADDASPRSPKHFFVWNPPIMNLREGKSTGLINLSRKSPKQNDKVAAAVKSDTSDKAHAPVEFVNEGFPAMEESHDVESSLTTSTGKFSVGGKQLYRRHAADETALLLAKAVANNIRCIAFCKTRNLVEWVYEKAVLALKGDSSTQHLASRVESYRGGYSVEARRLIEQRLFQGELLAVVGTSALELGVDIGGIDLTLHCGYPTSLSSLLQQAGRAGRGGARLNVHSLAIMVTFNSPSEQHIWRNPSCLLSCGVLAPASLPINSSLLQSHMLCAGAEFPLAREGSVLDVLQPGTGHARPCFNDLELFGPSHAYLEAQQVLISNGSLVEDTSLGRPQFYKAQASIRKPWSKVSLRSIEPINYAIVDISHPKQAGRFDSYCEESVMDTIPYSRVFYHAFPGAIIRHRGKKYEVQSMTRPPPFASSQNAFRGSCCLAAFAKPTNARYLTRPLSTLLITVVKQMERVDSAESSTAASSQKDYEEHESCFAGTGILTVKREVHGYKKLSPITRVELSRSEISLPPMEFDTYGLWIDTEAGILSSQLTDYDAGVHALSHALLAVAPLFVPCGSSDIDCDHRYFECTKIILFDVRAGGAGTCAQLWKFLFVKDGLLEAAINLLKSCPSCDVAEGSYDGGCPACLRSGNCIKFNQNLSRKAGLVIAERMLQRLQKTNAFAERIGAQGNMPMEEASGGVSGLLKTKQTVTSPRRRKRALALRDAMDLKGARDRQVVVGRPSWPLDGNSTGRDRQERAG